MCLADNELNTQFSFQEEFKAQKKAFSVEGEGCNKETIVLLLSCWKTRPFRFIKTIEAFDKVTKLKEEGLLTGINNRSVIIYFFHIFWI